MRGDPPAPFERVAPSAVSGCGPRPEATGSPSRPTTTHTHGEPQHQLDAGCLCAARRERHGGARLREAQPAPPVDTAVGSGPQPCCA
eukprot:363337-Chlamydomonas_euryale.AAC.10